LLLLDSFTGFDLETGQMMSDWDLCVFARSEIRIQLEFFFLHVKIEQFPDLLSFFYFVFIYKDRGKRSGEVRQ
jgi:hypothetical protein